MVVGGVVAVVAIGVWLSTRSPSGAPEAAREPSDAGIVWREPSEIRSPEAPPEGLDGLARAVDSLTDDSPTEPAAEATGNEGAGGSPRLEGAARDPATATSGQTPPARPALSPEQEAARARATYIRNVQSLEIANRLLLSIVPEIETARAAGDTSRVDWLERTADRLRTRRGNLQRALDEAGEPPPPPE